MKKKRKSVFFIVALLIVVFTVTSFTGITMQNADVTKTYIKGADDIRWGIDIRGGVDVTFSPPPEYTASQTDTKQIQKDMESAESIIKVRMVSQNITDYEIYTDTDKQRIIVRFPWKSDEADFNPELAIKELGETALLTFREGYETDELGRPSGVTASTIILEGTDVTDASVAFTSSYQGGPANTPCVSLELSSDGAKKFAEATGRLQGQIISIWMDDTMISAPRVQNQINDGNAMITGEFTATEAKDLAGKINAGALPFKLYTENYNTISPTLGMGAKDAMVLAGAIAFVAVALFMMFTYKLPGTIAVICLTGQVGFMIAAITGYLPIFPSFTLTLPGIAGIILSIGMGVDANVITAERIKEEIKSGKTIEGAIDAGSKRAFTAIFDGNITVIIVAVILMGSFGPPASLFARMLKPVFFMFGPATTGTIYSFGYTLLIGVIANFVMAIYAGRLMLKSIAKFTPFRKAWLYGGEK